MKSKTSIAAFCIILLFPSAAFAFVNTPTLSATFPAILLLIVPFVFFENHSLAKMNNGATGQLARSCALSGIIATTAMFILGRAHMAIINYILWNTAIGIYGIHPWVGIQPSMIDILFSCTLGSYSLITREGYIFLNVIVIAIFLLPTIVVYFYGSLFIVGRAVNISNKSEFIKSVFRIKSIQYAFLVAVAFMFSVWG